MRVDHWNYILPNYQSTEKRHTEDVVVVVAAVVVVSRIIAYAQLEH